MMTTIKTFPTRVEADIAKLELDAAEIPSFITGVGAAMEGGIAGVQLQVPEAEVERAMEILGDK
jgi:Putative prokaryotic signal transducing protein